MTAYEINGKEYEVEYDLDNCPRSAHALRNRISSSGNAGGELFIQTDAVTIKVEVNNSDVEYRYDAFGRRIIRQKGSTKSALIWWGNSEKDRRPVGLLDRNEVTCPDIGGVKVREASLNQCAEHKHQAGQTVIQNDIMAHPDRLNSVIARAKDGSKFKLEWYHKNYLDHVYAVSDDDGDILEHYRYSAFGQVTIYDENGQLQNTTQIDNTILWNTRRRDEVSGYYMYKFRHYSPELGRWPSRDPIEERGGVNLYGFVGNEPVGRLDKLGLACILVNGELICSNPNDPPLPTPGTVPAEGQSPGPLTLPAPWHDPTPDDFGTEVPNDSFPDEEDLEPRDKKQLCCRCFQDKVPRGINGTGKSNLGRPTGPAGIGDNCKTIGEIRTFRYEGRCESGKANKGESCVDKKCYFYVKWKCVKAGARGAARYSPEKGRYWDPNATSNWLGIYSRYSKCK